MNLFNWRDWLLMAGGAFLAAALVIGVSLLPPAHAQTPLDEIKRLAADAPDNHWFEIPGTTLDCLTRDEFDALGASSMWSANSVGCVGIFTAWNGALVDRDGQRVHLVAQGGHAAYGGNETYRLDLDTENGWQILSLPAPEVDPTEAQFAACAPPIRCPAYGAPAGHTYSMHAIHDGLAYYAPISAFPTNTAFSGAWIVNLDKHCIEADRWALLPPETARLNPQNVRADCDPRAAWRYLPDVPYAVPVVLPGAGEVHWVGSGRRSRVTDLAGTLLLDADGAPRGTQGFQGAGSLINGAGYVLVPDRGLVITMDYAGRSRARYDDGRPVVKLPRTAEGISGARGLHYDPSSGRVVAMWGTEAYSIDLDTWLTSTLTPDSSTERIVWDRTPVTGIGVNTAPYTGVWYLPAADVHCGLTEARSIACLRLVVDAPAPPGPGQAWQVCPCFDAGTECRVDGSECRPAGDVPEPPEPTFVLQDAIDAAGAGGTVTVPEGTWRQCGVIREDGVTIRGEPGAALEGVACEGKAALVVEGAGNFRITGSLEISDISVPNGNGSCVRMEGGVNLTVERLHCHDSEQGIFGGRKTRGGGTVEDGDYSVVVVRGSLFERLGAGGASHLCQPRRRAMADQHHAPHSNHGPLCQKRRAKKGRDRRRDRLSWIDR